MLVSHIDFCTARRKNVGIPSRNCSVFWVHHLVWGTILLNFVKSAAYTWVVDAEVNGAIWSTHVPCHSRWCSVIQYFKHDDAQYAMELYQIFISHCHKGFQTSTSKSRMKRNGENKWNESRAHNNDRFAYLSMPLTSVLYYKFPCAHLYCPVLLVRWDIDLHTWTLLFM